MGTDTSMLALNTEFAQAKHIIENTPQVAKRSQAFDLIREAHLAVGHAAGEKTHQELHRRWSGISRKLCDMYCKICSCVTQKTQLVRPTDLTPIISRTLNSRGQVDLIDMQSVPDRGYTWILHYQDHALKFSLLVAMKDRRASTVAWKLYKIFRIIGAPRILQSDNRREFVNEVINELAQLFDPEITIINGRARHPQSQGSVERANQCVKRMLNQWVSKRKSGGWKRGLPDVQWMKNVRHHRTLNNVPYTLLFGQRPRLGICGSVPQAVLQACENLADENGVIQEEAVVEHLQEAALNLLGLSKGTQECDAMDEEDNYADVEEAFDRFLNGETITTVGGDEGDEDCESDNGEL